jgi:hypothetical protein
MALANVTDVVGNIVNLEAIQNSLSLLLKIVGGLVGIYIIYHIINFILERAKARKIKKIYKNTENIRERLDDIEEKLDKVLGKRKERAEKKKKK